MVVLLKKNVHSCPPTGLIYAYPAKLCPICFGRGIDLQMDTREVYKENVKRQFEKRLRGGN